MDKEFVPPAESSELKELGFDKPCFGYYDCERDFKFIPNKEKFLVCEIAAPTFSQAFRFFREKYGYDIHVRGTNFRASYVIGIPKEINMKAFDGYPLVISWDYITDETGVRKTYEEAELDCLRRLIKIVKEKQNG